MSKLIEGKYLIIFVVHFSRVGVTFLLIIDLRAHGVDIGRKGDFFVHERESEPIKIIKTISRHSSRAIDSFCPKHLEIICRELNRMEFFIIIRIILENNRFQEIFK